MITDRAEPLLGMAQCDNRYRQKALLKPMN
jgi:hypothetical protein